MDFDPPFSFLNFGDDHNRALPQLPGNDNMKSATNLLLSLSICSEENKVKIHKIVVEASEELQQMAVEKEPLWLIDKEAKTEVLNNAEYNRKFACLDATLEEVIRVITKGGPLELPEFNESTIADHQAIGSTTLSTLSAENDFSSVETESSRAVGFVSVDPLSLANMIMNVEHWSSAFPNIVSRASNLGVLSTGEPGNPHGVLQVVSAEFHFPSPLAKIREMCFARYCRQLNPTAWLVVDVSLESIFPDLASTCRRRPSGCLIEALNKGSSKVTWVENNAVNNGSLGSMFRLIAAQAFGAKRWIATLEREYDRKYILRKQFDQITSPKTKNKNIAGLGAGKKSLLKLAERMVRSFHGNVSSWSTENNPWRTLPISGAEDMLVKTRFNPDHPGAPTGVSMTIATSVRLQKPHKDVFKFLCSVHERHKWDILSGGRVAQEIEQISFGPDPANRVSLLVSVPGSNGGRDKKKATAAVVMDKPEIMYVQETLSDSVGLYLVYAPIVKAAMNHIMDGKDPDIVAILPSGFVVFPDSDHSTRSGRGCILTMAFEIVDANLLSSTTTPAHHDDHQSLSTAHTILTATVDMIKAAILPSGP